MEMKAKDGSPARKEILDLPCGEAVSFEVSSSRSSPSQTSVFVNSYLLVCSHREPGSVNSSKWRGCEKAVQVEVQDKLAEGKHRERRQPYNRYSTTKRTRGHSRSYPEPVVKALRPHANGSRTTDLRPSVTVDPKSFTSCYNFV